MFCVTIFLSKFQCVCVTVLVPQTVTLIMETVPVSQAWLGHTVTIA